jgi:hypothetical protein
MLLSFNLLIGLLSWLFWRSALMLLLGCSRCSLATSACCSTLGLSGLAGPVGNVRAFENLTKKTPVCHFLIAGQLSDHRIGHISQVGLLTVSQM